MHAANVGTRRSTELGGVLVMDRNFSSTGMSSKPFDSTLSLNSLQTLLLKTPGCTTVRDTGALCNRHGVHQTQSGILAEHQFVIYTLTEL